MNSIEKKKGALIAFAIIALVLGLAAFAGGIVLAFFGGRNLAGDVFLAGGIELGVGCALILGSGFAIFFGIKYLWVGLSLKATKGPIADENLAKDKEGKNIKRCPKCGCANSAENKQCSNCGEPLE